MSKRHTRPNHLVRRALLVAGAFFAAGSPPASATGIQLTSGSFSVVEYEWSPNDQAIAFIELTENGTNRLATVPGSGGAVTVLAPDSGDYSSPHWSADGAFILTSFLEGGQRKVCALNAITGSCLFGNPNPGRFAPRFGPSGTLDEVVGSTDGADTIVLMDLIQGTETIVATSALGLFGPHWRSSVRGIVFDAAGSNNFMQAHSIGSPRGPTSELTNCSCDVCMEDVDPLTGALAYAAGVVDEQGNNQLFVLEGSGPGAILTQLTVQRKLGSRSQGSRIDNSCRDKVLGFWQEDEHGGQADSQGGSGVAAVFG